MISKIGSCKSCNPVILSKVFSLKTHYSYPSVQLAYRSTTPPFPSRRALAFLRIRHSRPPSLRQRLPATSSKPSFQLSDYQKRARSRVSSGATARSVRIYQKRSRQSDRRSRTSVSDPQMIGRNTCRTSSGDESLCCTSALQKDTR